jgi:tRNA(adenine34) deaminase
MDQRSSITCSISGTDHTPMQRALEEAKAAGQRGEIPVGAVIVQSATNKIITIAGNYCEETNDPTAHAEILAVREATAQLGTQRLSSCDLYVTLEPCAMCAAAISFARIRRLYFGAYDPKSGGVEHGACFYNRQTCHHKPEIYGGIMEQECSALLSAFFKKLRE